MEERNTCEVKWGVRTLVYIEIPNQNPPRSFHYRSYETLCIEYSRTRACIEAIETSEDKSCNMISGFHQFAFSSNCGVE